MDLFEILTRLEKLEDAFLSGLQEIRSVKAEIQKQANGNPTLEPLLEAEEVAKHSFEIHKVMELHEKLGIATLILGLMACGLRLGMRDKLGWRLRAFAMVLMAAMISTVSFGAYLGGRLVFEFGVGGAFGAPRSP